MHRNRLTIVSLTLAVTFAVLLFREALVYMVGRWASPDYNHCAIMPVVIAYLVWERRRAFTAQPATTSWGGLAAMAAGLSLYWLGELAGEYFTLYTAFFFTLVGLLWTHLGWARLRPIVFPVALIPTMFPLPTFLNNKLTFHLQLASSALGVRLLQLFGLPALREGNVIDLGFTQLQVVEACSGLRFVFPLAILGVLLASFMRGPLWKKACLVLSTLPLSVGLNAFRIAATGVLHQSLGAEAAEGFFHDFSGWVVFMVALGVLLGEMYVLGKLGPRRSAAGSGTPRFAPGPIREESFETSDVSKPERLPWRNMPKVRREWIPCALALSLLCATLVMSYGLNFRRPVAPAQPLATFPLKLGPYEGQRAFLDAKVLDELDVTDYTAVLYGAGNQPPIDFYVAYYAEQRKGESIHSPETCLPGAGWVVEHAGAIEVRLPGTIGKSFSANRIVLRKFGRVSVGYFWFDLAGRIAVNAYQVKLSNFWNALTQRRTDGALVRVMTEVGPSETLEEADRRLTRFLAEVLPVLNAYLGR